MLSGMPLVWPQLIFPGVLHPVPRREPPFHLDLAASHSTGVNPLESSGRGRRLWVTADAEPADGSKDKDTGSRAGIVIAIAAALLLACGSLVSYGIFKTEEKTKPPRGPERRGDVRGHG
ncbi:hypothetical protein ACFU76_23550 [Streptomyces sp. NPDC057539]|uniref:hypothetical protein n=1 Tax=Streptomyces sp. NPDC057539 TaxID=3346159 RepID=UPI0036911C54